jgi:hypothetical protein
LIGINCRTKSFESKMEKLKVKERERITHRGIALGRYKDLAFRACDKSNLLSTASEVSACRRFPSRARRNVYPDSVSVSSEEEKICPVEL